MTNPNTGHGHVFPRPDGVKMRCGGPGLCKECSKDHARAKQPLPNQSLHVGTVAPDIKFTVGEGDPASCDKTPAYDANLGFFTNGNERLRIGAGRPMTAEEIKAEADEDAARVAKNEAKWAKSAALEAEYIKKHNSPDDFFEEVWRVFDWVEDCQTDGLKYAIADLVVKYRGQGNGWRKLEDSLPYDENVLFLTKDGNVVQDFWYDCDIYYLRQKRGYTHYRLIDLPNEGE